MRAPRASSASDETAELLLNMVPSFVPSTDATNLQWAREVRSFCQSSDGAYRNLHQFRDLLVGDQFEFLCLLSGHSECSCLLKMSWVWLGNRGLSMARYGLRPAKVTGQFIRPRQPHCRRGRTGIRPTASADVASDGDTEKAVWVAGQRQDCLPGAPLLDSVGPNDIGRMIAQN